mmetsp:Transcript_8601/g.18621  ORF Transcript_8601/g.18621 Transcript_8601/m.18621 type:complete len:277 (+) Transcript_8601:760-1590(+)
MNSLFCLVILRRGFILGIGCRIARLVSCCFLLALIQFLFQRRRCMRGPSIKDIVFALPISALRKLFKVLVNASLQLVYSLNTEILDRRVVLHFILEQCARPFASNSPRTVHQHLFPTQLFLGLVAIEPSGEFRRLAHFGIQPRGIGRVETANGGFVVIAHVNDDAIFLRQFLVIIRRFQVLSVIQGNGRGLAAFQAVVHKFLDGYDFQLMKATRMDRQIVREFEFRAQKYALPTAERPTKLQNAVASAREGAIQTFLGHTSSASNLGLLSEAFHFG